MASMLLNAECDVVEGATLLRLAEVAICPSTCLSLIRHQSVLCPLFRSVDCLNVDIAKLLTPPSLERALASAATATRGCRAFIFVGRGFCKVDMLPRLSNRMFSLLTTVV